MKTKRPNTRQQIASILATLPPKNREILERRFGIGRDMPETLESIGKSYKITRERVRQIQEYGIKKLTSESCKQVISPTFFEVEKFIRANSGIVCERDLFEKLALSTERPYLSLALRFMPGILYGQETSELNSRYSLSGRYMNAVDSFLQRLHRNLTQIRVPMKFSNLILTAKKDVPQDCLEIGHAIERILSISKRIQRGPFGDYGLVEWPAIRPRGVRDKAHLVFERERRPLHFRELSGLIDNYFRNTSISGSRPVMRPGIPSNDGATSFRGTHPQTVHNELIKDSRFVLIGRGLYALAAWGYEAGTVKDVIMQIFKETCGVLDKDEVLDLISKRRFVKPNTVLLNLQNKQYFKKQKDGKYYLA